MSTVTVEQVASLVIGFNNGHILISHTNPITGSTVHHINADTAQLVAEQTVAAATKDIPLPYLLASIAIESAFDSEARNCNRGPFGSNPGNDPLGYDEGLCQFKTRYLIGQHGIKNVEEALAFSRDVKRAVPHMVSLLTTKLQDARGVIAAGLPSVADNLWRNPYVLAAAEYNFGASGGTKMARSAKPVPGHCTTIIKFEQRFAGQLGLPSVFA